MRQNRAYTMTAKNHDGHNHDGHSHDSHKVYRDGHSNEKVKDQRRTFKKSPNSRSYRLQKTRLWPS